MVSRPPPLLALCLLLAFAAFLFFFRSLALLSASPSLPRPSPPVGIYRLSSPDSPFSLSLSTWGASLLSLLLPDSAGRLADVVLGYGALSHYLNDTAYLGALVGRVANRIAGAHFLLHAQSHRLSPNSGPHTLHGGPRGFSKVVWTLRDRGPRHLTLYYHSVDGDQGFPGDLDVFVTYNISGPYQLSLHMNATATNKPTPVNLAQHTYWNLAGHNAGTILSHTLQIFASQITPVDRDFIPTGTFRKVAATPYDFRHPTPVGSRIDHIPGGYDINYVLSSALDAHGMRKVAVLRDPQSGRTLQLWANQPGVQFYSGNFLNNVQGKGGHVYGQHSGLCLETQGFPDAVNHPNFPSQIINPGQIYRHDMLFKFSF